ncbi:MAG: PEGA domain-containing protein [Kofleriaceae bacterium]|nr:PEGA domain-containing protein [Myxococcales bacterium]MCB9560520.1 PEGA domain-containing protein [Kofleriaceae bacterium]
MTIAYVLRRWTHVAAFSLVALALSLALPGALGTAHAATKYKVRVDSAPQGATVYVDKKEAGPVGVTPWEGSLTAGSHKIIVELDGYMPAEKTVKIARTRKLQDIFVPLIKKADPPRIDVRADADKNVFGATVYLDGQAQGTVPTLLTTDPGRHLVEIKKEGFQDFSTWVEVKENEKATLTPFLKEIAKPKIGTIVVEADVPDAEVYLDGNLQPDKTPAVLSNVIEGLHVVEVRKEPAIPWKQTVQVQAGQQVKVRGELKSTLGGQGGAVRVLSNIQGAHVFLDGTDMGAVPVDIKDVKPGEHVIEVKAPGYQTREERVTVNAGSSTVLKLDLNAEAKTEARIKVVSPVPGADVYIDGASAGKVPAEQAVSAGEHFVVVKLDGYKQFETKLRVEAGQTQTVSAELAAVGRLRILSDPMGGTVLINGVAVGTTPYEVTDLEVGATVVRVEMEGRIPFEKTMTIEGGQNEIISAKLEVLGPSDADQEKEQRGLSSFGARTLPRGRSTIDLGLGYPYFAEIAVKVGAGNVGNFGFDAGVGVRSMGSRSELGLGVRFKLVDADPFSAGAFTNLWWGTKLFDNSKRNGATWDAGLLASLTALTHVTVTGRLYLDMWSDRHCPEYNATDNTFDGEAIDACVTYRDVKVVGGGSNDVTDRIEALTGETGTDVFGRENGIRVMTSVVAEIAYQQRWNLWFMLEGAPFQGERALLTDTFTAPMLNSDYGTYLRVGTTYKF